MKIMMITILLALATSFFMEASAQTALKVPKTEFLGQKESAVSWGNLSAESFLSFEEWKGESDIKDQVPEWEKIVRERNHKEIERIKFPNFGREKRDYSRK